MDKKEEVFELYSKHVQQYKAEVWKSLNMITILGEREGIYFWDENGKRFINCHCNGGVFNLGHRNPEIRQVLIEGIEKYDIGNHHLVSRLRAELAQKLVESFHYKNDATESIEKVIFGVSGGEAVDLAIKIARGYTRKKNIISIKGAYHGYTGLAMGTAPEKLKENFYLNVPNFLQIEVEELNSIEKFIDGDTAAVILETSPATMGFYIIPYETMQHIREICTQKNIIFIIDEVQTGMGRTGEVWGYQKYDIVPDMVIAAKGLSGSMYPMSFTAFKKKYDIVFKDAAFGHVSTMGGAELGCLVALKSLEITMRNGFLEHVNQMATYFEQEFAQIIATKNSKIIHVRQLGLAMGIVFENDLIAVAMLSKCYENGIYCFFSGYDMRVIQFKPPLIITSEQAIELMDLFKKSLSELNDEYISSIAKK